LKTSNAKPAEEIHSPLLSNMAFFAGVPSLRTQP
jgi:hypothetical protein